MAGDGGEHGGDQLGIGRQRQEILRTGANGAQRRLGILGAAAGDDGGGDALLKQGLHQPGDVMGDVAEDQVRPLGAQHLKAGQGAIGLQQPRAAGMGQPASLAQLALQRADDEQACHQPALSDFTISVIEMPRRLSSTITTSPRATRRLLT